jgi:cell division transport system permease protein
LLEPWLSPEVLQDLPVPRLVALELEREKPATAGELTRALDAAGVDATVDDHGLWMKEIVRAGQMARIAAAGVAALLAAAAFAIIAFATRAALAAYREPVEVLHVTGAEDRFIAGLFTRRFARVSAVAGGFGALAAFAVGAGLRLVGGNEGLTPVLPLAWSDLLWPLLAPLITAAVGGLAARASCLALLRAMP